jgi:uncharacterized protein
MAMAAGLETKLTKLSEKLQSLPGALVAYSGGADSAFVAEMTHRALGDSAIAITADSPSLPRRELNAAIALADQRGWRYEVVRTAELDDERYASNPTDRCYYCKTSLFDVLTPMSEQAGWPVLLGTNTDDLGDYRPGQKAASENGALHPLVEAELSKSEVREASRSLGLPTAEKPASACLASRFAYGVRVTSEGLARVEAAEDELLQRGFRVVRVRDLGDDRARIEVSPVEVPALLEARFEIEEFLRALGFARIDLDEKGYRQGSLNELISISVRAGS